MNIGHLLRETLRVLKSLGARRNTRMRNGVRVFPKRRGSMVPSLELVNKLRDAE
jgi:hypothetical protein